MDSPEPCKLSRWQLIKQTLDNLDPEAFRQAMAMDPRPVMLDVRTAEEWSGGSFPGAVHLDYLGGEFLDRLEKLDPDRTYLVFCRSGRRSLRVCTLLKNAGFTKVYNLDGGLNAWHARYETLSASPLT